MKNCAESLIFVGAVFPAFVLSKRDGLVPYQSSGARDQMHIQSPPLSGEYPERHVDASDLDAKCASTNPVHRLRPATFRPSAGFKNTQAASDRSPITRRTIRALGRISIAVLIGVGATLAWQSYGGEMVRAWAPSLGWLPPTSLSEEVRAQLQPVALDIAILKRSVEQLGGNQDQLARKQDQMAQAFATLQLAVRDINQNILALAPLAPKTGHVSPKPGQLPAQ
jgi:hypothetical protein